MQIFSIVDSYHNTKMASTEEHDEHEVIISILPYQE